MKRVVIPFCLVLASCTDPVVSQVMVVVNADDMVRARSQSIVIRVVGGGRERSQLANCLPGDRCEVHREEVPIAMLAQRGLRVALAPDGRDWRRLYEVTATAFDGPNGTGSQVAEARVISGYVRGETRTVNLFLQGACIGTTCEPNETCRAGECVDPFVPPADLPPFVPVDAGTRDAGTDAGCSSAADCNDGVDCTNDDCIGGTCRNMPDDSRCGSGTDPCLATRCEASGCVDVPTTARCDDGVVCNGPERCVEGSCVNEGVPLCAPPLRCEGEMCVNCGPGAPCPGTQECVDGACRCDVPVPEPSESSCQDGVDNDCDGLRDCADPDCVGATPELCGPPGVDEDCDTLIDESCGEDNCADGIDNDGDFATDCDDTDCVGLVCLESGFGGSCDAFLIGCCRIDRFEECGDPDYNCNGIPGDGCTGDASVPDGGDACSSVEFCDNFFDDDCDGLMDCEQPSCSGEVCDAAGSVCRDGVCETGSENDCMDGFDDDGDGFTDCQDEDCSGAPCDVLFGSCFCEPTGFGSCEPGFCDIGDDASVAPDGGFPDF